MKNLYFAVALVLCSVSSIVSQDINSKAFKDLSLRNIGPAGMSGRITAIDAVESNPNIIYIGSASGGVWTSKNRGTTWEPIFEHEATMSIGAVKINQHNPDEIWVGTGEGNPRNSHNEGKGIYKSIDGGESWTLMGLEDTRVIHRIHIDPTDSDIVYVAALGTAWGKSKDRGVYKTIDGGKTWTNILFINEMTGAADMVVDPENPNKLFVAMWEHNRTPWGFNSGGGGSGLYRTFDGGSTWQKLGKEEGIKGDTLGRIGLAIASNKPDIMYALVESKNAQTLYRSNDGGAKWQKQSDKNVGNRPFYYSEIYVDPGNENRIFNLWSYVSKSEDGGKTFNTIMDYGNDVHPDHHAFWIDKHNPNFMINGNDGGLNISEDGGHNWRFITNLPVGQFYHVSVDNDFPYNIYGGMQDNGSWVGPAFVLKRGGIRNSDWQEIYFGDGFDVAPRADNNRYIYAMSQQGNVALIDKETGMNNRVKPVAPDTTELRFSWNSALALDPFNDCGVYFGSQFVHYSQDCGESWTVISPDLTTNDPAKQDQSKSGGLTLDVTGAENHTTLLAIAPSTLDKDIIWSGSDDGRVHVTSNGGDSWTAVEGRLPRAPKHAFVPQIEVSKHNKNEAFVVINNYRQHDWLPYLYHTTDLGKTWKNIASLDTMQSFACSIVQDHKEPNLLFAGMDDGLYVSINKGSKWTKWRAFPSVQIRDMKIQAEHDDLVLGTFGRSFWVLDDLEPFRAIAQREAFEQQHLYAWPPEDAYLTTSRSYDGIRFVAQGDFKGRNTSKNCKVKYWVNPDSIDVDAKKPKTLTMRVFDASGDTIRTRVTTPKPGLNTVSWGLDSKGANWPSWESPKEDADEPGGAKVLAGEYKIGLYFEGDSTYVDVQVKNDPRHDRASTTDEGIAQLEAYNTELGKAHDLFEELKGFKKELAFAKTYIQHQPDTLKTELTEEIKDLESHIDSLQLKFMQAKDVRGYVSNKGMLSELLWPTRGFMSPWRKPQANAIRQFTIFKDKVTEIQSGIDDFESNELVPFKEKIKGLPVVLFKE